MQFNNRPNECIQTTDGRTLWLSRSVAVAVSVLLVQKEQPFILVNQRGPGVPDFQGFWNLPCGYLDYDETTQEAAVREVWEECGVNLQPLLPLSEVDFFETPWDVNSRPTSAKQNVTIHHGLVAVVEELPTLTGENSEPDETMDMRWLPLQQVHQLEYAFNHLRQIHRFIERLSQQANRDYRTLLE